MNSRERKYTRTAGLDSEDAGIRPALLQISVIAELLKQVVEEHHSFGSSRIGLFIKLSGNVEDIDCQDNRNDYS